MLAGGSSIAGCLPSCSFSCTQTLQSPSCTQKAGRTQTLYGMVCMEPDRTEGKHSSCLVQIPDSVSFGSMTVAGMARRSLTVWNTGDAAVHCSWQVAQPFAIMPASATLAPGAAGQFEATFQPERAAAYDSVAGCSAEGGATSRVQVAACSAYILLECIPVAAVDAVGKTTPLCTGGCCGVLRYQRVHAGHKCSL